MAYCIQFFIQWTCLGMVVILGVDPVDQHCQCICYLWDLSQLVWVNPQTF